MTYVITCTSTCDLGKERLNQLNVKYACFKFLINQQEYEDNFFQDYDYEKFYEDIKNGLEPTTSQVGYGNYLEFFEPLLKEGKDVLHICLSSKLSGDYQTAMMVAEELNEKYPNKIQVIDSLGASAGYGMLVEMASDNLNKGFTLQDNIDYLEGIKLNIHHWFISSDLSSYVRGGRISKTAGLIGSALKICPLLNMPDDGSLAPVEKIRTKMKAQAAQVDKMQELCLDGLDYTGPCQISCSACDEDALKVVALIKERFPNIKEVPIYHVGTTIGSHTGPGTIALYFIGEKRKQNSEN